ncbi:hypothetical protein COU80_00125 [Candidatus Peregrinibacteria bacterium CG10_big_fil_rev_8_21_14_0_10_55_24]|nr:MAG: hypothetical protein COU80_00125 [Candidatus Peregrinibacteria bacterium CG10_big_fil_rev_8_21_14_0_10_55_24]
MISTYRFSTAFITLAYALAIFGPVPSLWNSENTDTSTQSSTRIFGPVPNLLEPKRGIFGPVPSADDYWSRHGTAPKRSGRRPFGTTPNLLEKKNLFGTTPNLLEGDAPLFGPVPSLWD